MEELQQSMNKFNGFFASDNNKIPLIRIQLIDIVNHKTIINNNKNNYKNIIKYKYERNENICKIMYIYYNYIIYRFDNLNCSSLFQLDIYLDNNIISSVTIGIVNYIIYNYHLNNNLLINENDNILKCFSSENSKGNLFYISLTELPILPLICYENIEYLKLFNYSKKDFKYYIILFDMKNDLFLQQMIGEFDVFSGKDIYNINEIMMVLQSIGFYTFGGNFRFKDFENSGNYFSLNLKYHENGLYTLYEIINGISINNSVINENGDEKEIKIDISIKEMIMIRLAIIKYILDYKNIKCGFNLDKSEEIPVLTIYIIFLYFISIIIIL